MSLNDSLQFVDDGTEDGGPGRGLPPWKLLVVDDEDEVHQVTRLALGGFRFAGRDLQLFHAYSAEEARRLMAGHPDMAVVLLDVVMETDHAGLDLVRHIRRDQGNRLTRIILRTGQPGQAPERQVITEYDINDYKEKTELTARKLFSTVYAALRGYRDLAVLDQSKRGLEKVIEASAALFEQQSLGRLAEGVLEQLAAMLYQEHDSVYVRGSGFAAQDEQGHLEILAATGEYEGFAGQDARQVLDPPILQPIEQVLRERRSYCDERSYIGYFRTDHHQDHVLYLNGGVPIHVPDRRLLELFGRNVAVALDNVHALEEANAAQEDLHCALADIIEQRSFDTSGHARRVGEYAGLLAAAAGLEAERVELIRRAAVLHDIGDIVLPERLLTKPGALDDGEWREMQQHTWSGHRLLDDPRSRLGQAAAVIALQHHERWDGSGYPQGLAGEAIDIYGRIVGLVDVFDSLPSRRCYRKAWSMDDTLGYLRGQAGGQFDPALVELLFENLDALLEIRARHTPAAA